ncbi:uncharacterized protein C8A04DRAFT_32057 [Dichotomopilus funicola]|uniref:DUF8035 domain-containing protein n=1 Tax=Dichotomopilus funicola TaxID=1934379 RepID=A0AAN6UWS7_9PEZI|nr:hypothetical protein C8A04DRAFT_32057 [Dichotomopilus funicola]
MLEGHGDRAYIPPSSQHLNSSGWAETIASEKRAGQAETPHGYPPSMAPPSLTTGTRQFEQRTFKTRSPDNELPQGAQGVLEGNGPKSGPESIHFDFVYDPSSKAHKDVSARLQLDIEPDWEGDLEEFCRLKRLGLINQAKKHFWSALGHVSTLPYVRVQYAEMLQACGDYKGFQALPFPSDWYFPLVDGTPADRNMGKLVANYALLDLLSQRHSGDYLQRAWQVVRHTFKALAHELSMGSTEIQLAVLCLRVLTHLERCTHSGVVEPAINYARSVLDWRRLYHDLLGDKCIWDFRDLFLATVTLFSWPETLTMLLGTTHLPEAVNTIIKDWSCLPAFDEAPVLGLLDLFTSLILQDHSPGMKIRNELLCRHAVTMVDSIRQHGRELMRTRPYVQWLLAKTICEPVPASEDLVGVRAADLNGVTIHHGDGVDLPIYIPRRRSGSPTWDMFLVHSTPMQQWTLEIAAKAAEEMGDGNLLTQTLKLLILRARDPKPWVQTLTKLQAEIQGDKEGHLATCLSTYIMAAADPIQESALLRALQKPGNGSQGALHFEDCQNASLKWAWAMLRALLKSENKADGPLLGARSSFLPQGFSLDGSKLPPYLADFSREKLQASVSQPMSPLPVDADEEVNPSKKEEPGAKEQHAGARAPNPNPNFSEHVEVPPREETHTARSWDPWRYEGYRPPNPFTPHPTPWDHPDGLGNDPQAETGDPYTKVNDWMGGSPQQGPENHHNPSGRRSQAGSNAAANGSDFLNGDPNGYSHGYSDEYDSGAEWEDYDSLVSLEHWESEHGEQPSAPYRPYPNDYPFSNDDWNNGGPPEYVPQTRTKVRFDNNPPSTRQHQREEPRRVETVRKGDRVYATIPKASNKLQRESQRRRSPSREDQQARNDAHHRDFLISFLKFLRESERDGANVSQETWLTTAEELVDTLGESEYPNPDKKYPEPDERRPVDPSHEQSSANKAKAAEPSSASHPTKPTKGILRTPGDRASKKNNTQKKPDIAYHYARGTKAGDGAYDGDESSWEVVPSLSGSETVGEEEGERKLTAHEKLEMHRKILVKMQQGVQRKIEEELERERVRAKVEGKSSSFSSGPNRRSTSKKDPGPSGWTKDSAASKPVKGPTPAQTQPGTDAAETKTATTTAPQRVPASRARPDSAPTSMPKAPMPPQPDEASANQAPELISVDDLWNMVFQATRKRQGKDNPIPAEQKGVPPVVSPIPDPAVQVPPAVASGSGEGGEKEPQKTAEKLDLRATVTDDHESESPLDSKLKQVEAEPGIEEPEPAPDLGANDLTTPAQGETLMGEPSTAEYQVRAEDASDDKSKNDVPLGARWTKISCKLVHPDVLKIGKERFKVRDDFIVVLRVLSKQEIQAYIDATVTLRERRKKEMEREIWEAVGYNEKRDRSGDDDDRHSKYREKDHEREKDRHRRPDGDGKNWDDQQQHEQINDGPHQHEQIDEGQNQHKEIDDGATALFSPRPNSTPSWLNIISIEELDETESKPEAKAEAREEGEAEVEGKGKGKDETKSENNELMSLIWVGDQGKTGEDNNKNKENDGKDNDKDNDVEDIDYKKATYKDDDSVSIGSAIEFGSNRLRRRAATIGVAGTMSSQDPENKIKKKHDYATEYIRQARGSFSSGGKN